MRRNLAVTLIVMLAVMASSWVAYGEGETTAVDAEAVALEQKREKRQASAKKRPRFENVRYITATPMDSRRGERRAPPSTTVIEYDNNNAVTRLGDTAGIVVGNQFDVGGGGNPIAGPWTITGFAAQNAGPAYGSTATVVFFGGPGAGTTAPVLGVLYVTLTGGINSFSLASPITGTGSFLGGVVNSTYGLCTVTSVPPGTSCDGVALDTAQNSTNPLGFHGFSIAAFVIPGTDFNTIGSQNAIFKVFGSALPIELMSFSVESED
ncbi:MAG: hypothetical protein AAF560_06390 [Acidobacteriota bacterium]